MRRIVLLMHTSLDGYVAGADGDMSWILHDQEMFAYVDSHIEKASTALYGRVTYQMMESYWPTVLKNPTDDAHSLRHAHWVEAAEKIVVSKTLQGVVWNNTKQIKEQLAEEISALKTQPGGDIMIFGSPRLTHSMMALGLIDDFLINVNPFLLGGGMPLFQNMSHRQKLSLSSCKTFNCGVVGLHYRRA